jgi:predicted nucleic acid-binding protein
VTVVVSDASPLIALHKIGHLALLEALFGAVVIPPAVKGEVTPGVTLPAWIEERPLAQPAAAQVLRGVLDAGESEAIALALELKASRLLMDERAGRRLAQGLGLFVTGTLGVLYMAKRQGRLAAIRPLIDALIQGGFRVAPQLYERVIADAGEGDPPS